MWSKYIIFTYETTKDKKLNVDLEFYTYVYLKTS